MCGPHRRFAPLLSRTLLRIPYTVSTVATGTIVGYLLDGYESFNTVNGKHCCNPDLAIYHLADYVFQYRKR